MRWILRVIGELDRAVENGLKQRAMEREDTLPQNDHDLRILLDALRAAADGMRRISYDVEQEGRRYAELVEFVSPAYVETDPDLLIRRANAAAARLLQWPERALIGKPLIAFVAARQFTEFLHRFNALRKDGGTIAEWPVWLRPQEGNAVQATLTAAAIRDADGTLNGIRCLLREGA